ncbi:MAG: hypothetical protein FJX76_01740 [Armatimonadetes bacterium]|nr:hypothetical protein [Armatimonadota bacterium]
MTRCKYCGATLHRTTILARERAARRATVKFFVFGALFVAVLGGIIYWQSGASARQHEEYRQGYNQGIQAGAVLASRMASRPLDSDLEKLLDTEYVKADLGKTTLDFERGWKDGARSAIISRKRQKYTRTGASCAT